MKDIKEVLDQQKREEYYEEGRNLRILEAVYSYDLKDDVIFALTCGPYFSLLGAIAGGWVAFGLNSVLDWTTPIPLAMAGTGLAVEAVIVGALAVDRVYCKYKKKKALKDFEKKEQELGL